MILREIQRHKVTYSVQVTKVDLSWRCGHMYQVIVKRWSGYYVWARSDLTHVKENPDFAWNNLISVLFPRAHCALKSKFYAIIFIPLKNSFCFSYGIYSWPLNWSRASRSRYHKFYSPAETVWVFFIKPLFYVIDRQFSP